MLASRYSWIWKAAIAAILLALLLRNADLADVRERMGRIPPWTYALGLGMAVLGIALQALRWKILLRNTGVTFRECYVFLGLGAALAMVSPSSALSDGAVGYWMGKREHMVLRSLSALFAARLIGVAAGLLLLLAALPSHAWILREFRLEWSPRGVLLAAIPLLAALGAALFLARGQRKRLRSLRAALPSLRPADLAAAAGLSLVVHLCLMGVYWLGYRGVAAPVAYPDVVFFTPLITFLGMLPVSIGGMGLREGLGIFFYTLLPGVAPEQVLAQAGFIYLLMIGMAGINLTLAAATLGLPGRGARPVVGH